MNDVSRSFRGNSNAARDIAHHLHPYTNFKKHEQTGPLTIVRDPGSGTDHHRSLISRACPPPTRPRRPTLPH